MNTRYETIDFDLDLGLDYAVLDPEWDEIVSLEFDAPGAFEALRQIEEEEEARQDFDNMMAWEMHLRDLPRG